MVYISMFLPTGDRQLDPHNPIQSITPFAASRPNIFSVYSLHCESEKLCRLYCRDNLVGSVPTLVILSLLLSGMKR